MGVGVCDTGGCSASGLMGMCRFNLETEMGQVLGQHEDTVL